MARKRERVIGFLGDLFKLAIVLLLLGGILFFFLGDKIMRTRELHNVDMHYEIDADEKLTEPTDKLVRKSLLWRTYFKYLPAEEVSEEAEKLKISVHFRRDENSSNRTDGSGTSHNYSPGKLLLRLRVLDPGRKSPLYSKVYDWELKPIIIAQTDAVISDEKRDREFADKEKMVIKHDLPGYLNLAAISLLRKRSDLHDQYAPAVALTVGNKDETLAKAAYKAFTDMELEIETLESVQDQVKKERLKAKGTSREKGLNKIQDYIEKELKRLRSEKSE